MSGWWYLTLVITVPLSVVAGHYLGNWINALPRKWWL